VKIDLDMQLLKPLPKDWFDAVSLGFAIVGQYDKYSIKD